MVCMSMCACVPQVMGGECNYLHKVVVQDGRVRLEEIPPVDWKDGRGVRWSNNDITALLDTAEVRINSHSPPSGCLVGASASNRTYDDGVMSSTKLNGLSNTSCQTLLVIHFGSRTLGHTLGIQRHARTGGR